MTLTAVLFAGGMSRRMGRDKATLAFSGEPLWARQLRLLRELQPRASWVSARGRPAWCPPEVESVLDQPPSHGPLSGLAAALARLPTSHLLALAVDLPEMTAAHLQKLWSLARPGCGIVPMSGGYAEPLCAIYPVEAAAAAGAALAGNDASLQSLVRILLSQDRVQTYPLSEAEKPLYRNLNTPADLKE